MIHTLSNSTFYDGSELSHRSSTLPRRHRRHLSSESTFVISSRDCSPIRRRSPVYSNGSLPRSTHSIPATSTQSKTQRTVPSKHIINEQNRLTAKSGEIYRSPKRLGTLDNRITNDRLFRTMNSGPSSMESGKTSMFNSGPSSIDSGKVSYSRTSGHSSFESHASASTITTNPSPNRSSYFNGSPKFTPKHQLGTSKLATESINRAKASMTNGGNSSTRRVLDEIPVLGKPPVGIPNSNSNNSITLQVTTSNDSNIPNTKIFVQNSPVRSVITLENGKLSENSNVYIINNETTTNGNGEIIKRSISKQTSTPRSSSKMDKENDFCLSETEGASETADTLSMISETSPVSSMVTSTSPDSKSNDLETTKFTKNINNDATMNNGRKFSLPMCNTSSNIVYKNCLKTVTDMNPSSPLNNKNGFILDDLNHDKHDSMYEQMAGSVGNLRYIEKNEKKLNSNCDLKNLPYESSGNLSKLNSNPAINTDSIAHILHKNMIAVGSEPNLAINSDCKQKLICDKSDKNGVDRRYSTSKENGSPVTHELYNFPSLTDLSFNFTSLAAQKILQGVSINSIDTLVELNMAQEKQQNNVNGPSTAPPAICTDYGMV